MIAVRIAGVSIFTALVLVLYGSIQETKRHGDARERRVAMDTAVLRQHVH
jgi:hypothetical protein